jgi:hypothetical protein
MFHPDESHPVAATSVGNPAGSIPCAYISRIRHLAADRDDVRPLLPGQFLERDAAGADPGIVEQQVDAAVGLLSNKPATAPEIAAIGVDLISSGWITHSAPILDLGLDIAG